MKELQYLNKYYLKYKWRLLLGIIFVTAANWFGILIPQRIGDALDFAQTQVYQFKNSGDAANATSFDSLENKLLYYGLIVISFMIIKGLFMFLMRQTIIVTSRLIEYDMRKEIYDHLQLLDTSYYKQSKTGDIMARISEDVSKVRNYLGPGILYTLNLISLFIFTIYAMFALDPKLAAYALIPLPILSISIYYVSNIINKKSTIIQKQVSKLTSIAQEVFSGIRVVKSYGKEQQFNEYFEMESENFKKYSMDMAKVNAYFFPLMVLLINISTLIVLYIGGNEVATNVISPSTIAEFIIYVNMLTWPVTAIGWIASIIQEAEVSQGRINQLLKEKSKIENGNYNPNVIKGRIEFNGVSFTYPETGIMALSNINLEIKAGQKIAFVGRTSAGKSTIAELLLRMYNVTSGEILIDGIPINQYEKSSLRLKIGYVPQDIFLFSDTVANNIAFGADEVSMDAIKTYAAHASVKEEIERLPEGFETIVGERGVSLSGGQKQRISIARAMIKGPDLIILDDCLSAVDTETEQKITAFLNEEMKTKTAIIITHRLTSLTNYDQIYFIHEGKIAEQGTHNELMELEGHYAELYNLSLVEEN